MSQGTTGSFTIPAGTTDMAVGTSVSYDIILTAKAADPSKVDWVKAGTCDTTNGGRATAGGFFNVVAMSSDSDGASNNDACIPVTATATLTLIKKIVDANGQAIPSKAADAKYFTLVAAGASNLSGSSSTSGAVGATGTVKPGIYQLHETPNLITGNLDGSVNGGYSYGSWECTGKTVSADNKITLGYGDNVTCTVKNTPVPPFHVVKNATTPGSTANTHVGQAVSPDANGTLWFDYTITVTNDGDFIGNSGPVLEWFQVPAGLVWDAPRTATIEYLPGSTGATAAGFTAGKAWSEADLKHSAVIATSIQKLPAKGSVSFKVRIPLKFDTAIASGQTQTNYQLNAADLAKCTSSTSAGGNAYTDGQFGVPNVTSIFEENQTYTDIPTQDNVACIPVSAGKVHVVKDAATPIAGNSHIGQQVTVNPDGTLSVVYEITVTNSGTSTVNTGAITDKFTPPAGLLWDGSKTATVTFDAGTTGATRVGGSGTYSQAELGATAGATLATSINNLPAGKSVSFTITMPLKINTAVLAGQTQSEFERNLTSLATCTAGSDSQGAVRQGHHRHSQHGLAGGRGHHLQQHLARGQRRLYPGHRHRRLEGRQVCSVDLRRERPAHCLGGARDHRCDHRGEGGPNHWCPDGGCLLRSRSPTLAPTRTPIRPSATP